MNKPDVRQIIQPAQHLDIIFAVNEKKQQLNARSTVIYDIDSEEEYFLIAQTQPPILKSMTGETIEASFMWRPTSTDDTLRYAFHTDIRDLITDYALSKGRRVQAIRLSYPKHFFEYNYRFFYRVQTIRDCPITLWIAGHRTPLSIIDISEGGLCFSYAASIPFLSTLQEGDKFKITLGFDEEKLIGITVKVVRIFQKDEFPRMKFMGVKYLQLSDSSRNIITTAIKKTERIMLRKRAGLE